MNTVQADIANCLNGGTVDGVQADTIHTQISMSATGTLTANTSGAILGTTGGAIQSVANGAITTPTTAGITSTAIAGGISLNGGPADNILFGTQRGRIIAMFPSSNLPALVAPWAINVNNITVGPALTGGGTSAVQPILLPPLHTGANLFQIQVNFQVGQSHPSVPATLPALTLFSKVASTSVCTQLATGSPATPGSGAAWFAAGALQAWSITINAVIDTTAKQYYLLLTDESGTGALSGNVYHSFILLYNGINDMRFP